MFVYWHKQSCMSQTLSPTSAEYGRTVGCSDKEEKKIKFFTVRVVTTCKRLPRELMDAPSLGVLKVDGALSNLI